MTTFDPSTLDLSGYRTMSVLTLTGSISVGNSLVENRPAPIPDFVEQAADRLIAAVEAAEDALTDRLDGKADLALERSFDTLVDRIWVVLRARLEFWHCYRHPGIALLSEEQQAKAGVEAGRKNADVAEELLARLFGDGLDFLRLAYPQQAAHMAARLRYIETRGLNGKFAELVGAQPAALAKICQSRYEAMVSERSARDNAVSVDLRPLRAKIRLAAEDYASLLLSTLHAGDEEWAKVVLKALRPMLSTDRPRAQGESEGQIVDSLAGEPVASEPALLDSPDDLEQD